MRVFIVVCLLSVLGGGVLAACPIRSRVVVPSKVVAPVVVKEVATVVPVAVFPLATAVPTYTAAYAPPVAAAPAPPAQPAGGGELRQIIDALKALDARLQRLEKGTAPQPKPADPFSPKTGALKSPKAGIALARCAVCHDAKVSAKLGKGITLWTDGKWSASDKLKIKALSEIRRNTMPPEDNSLGIKQLSDEEASQASDEISK